MSAWYWTILSRDRVVSSSKIIEIKYYCRKVIISQFKFLPDCASGMPASGATRVPAEMLKSPCRKFNYSSTRLSLFAYLHTGVICKQLALDDLGAVHFRCGDCMLPVRPAWWYRCHGYALDDRIMT